MTQRIVTLTLNPAIDLACEAEGVRPTQKTRTSAEHYDPGGGGLNVARVVHSLGGDALAVLLAGGVTGKFLEELLTEAGTPTRIIPIAGRTRLSVTVHDRVDGAEYRFVPEGPVITETEWQAALDAIEAADTDWVVASGSLPRGVPEDFYARLANACAARGRRFILDTSGAPLRAALGQGLHLIKPSLGEFEALLGRALPDPAAQDAAAMELLRTGAATMIVVSLGADGALLATADGVTRLASPPIVVRSAVGAGDSFVAGMTLGLARGMPVADAFTLGIATGTSAVAHYGTARPDPEEVSVMFQTIKKHSKINKIYKVKP